MKDIKCERRKKADCMFRNAASLADIHGLILRRISEVHYQLYPLNGAWLKNIYPGNRRIYGDPNKARIYLDLKDADWTLVDVVRSAIPFAKYEEAPNGNPNQ